MLLQYDPPEIKYKGCFNYWQKNNYRKVTVIFQGHALSATQNKNTANLNRKDCKEQRSESGTELN